VVKHSQGGSIFNADQLPEVGPFYTPISIHEFAHCLDGLDGEMVAVIVRFRPGCVDVTARSALQLKGLDDVQSVLT
jgi:hypothetical protein